MITSIQFVYLPMQLSVQGQWWSNFATHLSQAEQCFDLIGRWIRQVLQNWFKVKVCFSAKSMIVWKSKKKKIKQYQFKWWIGMKDAWMIDLMIIIYCFSSVTELMFNLRFKWFHINILSSTELNESILLHFNMYIYWKTDIHTGHVWQFYFPGRKCCVSGSNFSDWPVTFVLCWT